MDLGPHAFYIAASYAVTAVIVAGLILRAILDHRVQTRALTNFAGRGVRRRSGPAERDAGPAREGAHSALARPSFLDRG